MPERALGTILGGEDPPSEDEGVSKQALREKIMEASFESEGFSYDDCSLAMARIIVEAIEKYPCLRDVPMEPTYLTDTDGKMVWFEDRDSPAVYIRQGMFEVLKFLHPDEESPERKVMDEMTGFMWGWAYNAAASVCLMEPQPNPAIVEIG